MKYIFQLGFICLLSFIADILHTVIPLPIPASVYGLVLLFLLLCFKVVKVEQIEEVSALFIAVMPIFFISPSVSLITSFSAMKGSVLSLLLIIVVSTILTMGLTGVVTQLVMRIRAKSGLKQNTDVGGTEREMIATVNQEKEGAKHE